MASWPSDLYYSLQKVTLTCPAYSNFVLHINPNFK
jgi:hypothetical protein